MTDVRELFQRHGLRCTRQRELVYRALAATTAHPTPEELYQSVHADEPCLSLATVYNTLEALSQRGLCRKLPNSAGNGAARYDAVVQDHVHLATSDGRIMDVPQDVSDRILQRLGEDFIREIEQRMGVRVDGINVEVVADRTD